MRTTTGPSHMNATRRQRGWHGWHRPRPDVIVGIELGVTWAVIVGTGVVMLRLM